MTNALVVVAHYDDHFLFMGGTIERMKRKGWQWTVVSMCTPDARRRKLFEDCCAEQGVRAVAFQFADYQGGGVFSKNNADSMRETLLQAIGGQMFDWVFTHSRHPSGEYGGHDNHREVQSVVARLVHDGILGKGPGSLAYFSYRDIGGHVSSTASFENPNVTHYLQLTYDEVIWKCKWCKATAPIDGSLKEIGDPCPNPEAFEGDGLRLGRPVQMTP